VALVAQWRVDGAVAKAELDERVARADAEESARAALAQPVRNHESQSPPLGGSTAGGSVDGSQPHGAWDCIRARESGGMTDPNGNYGERDNPTYRGAYQMGFQEWTDMGGSGDPADAPPAEQDMRAQMLQAQRGWQPWSTRGMCGV